MNGNTTLVVGVVGLVAIVGAYVVLHQRNVQATIQFASAAESPDKSTSWIGDLYDWAKAKNKATPPKVTVTKTGAQKVIIADPNYSTDGTQWSGVMVA